MDRCLQAAPVIRLIVLAFFWAGGLAQRRSRQVRDSGMNPHCVSNLRVRILTTTMLSHNCNVSQIWALVRPSLFRRISPRQARRLYRIDYTNFAFYVGFLSC
ncbi:hypothetical protein R3P38DRAFT_2953391 [Favolaschia claudopus]|uniref:Secreted protein n=1 Tax=Favolaschia claudopus TaxID=2862362 RepID=A0AAW0BJ30_9AGAR